MNKVPARREPVEHTLAQSLEPIGEGDGPLRRLPLGILLRNRWVILGCVTVAVAATLVQTRRSVPVYQGVITVRLEEKEPNFPEVFRRVSEESQLATEMEEFRSRTLAGHAVTALGLRLRLIEPQRRRRGDILRDIRVSNSAASGEYRLVQNSDGRFNLVAEATGLKLGEVSPGERIEAEGLSFVLGAPALESPVVRFRIESPIRAADKVAGAVSVSQASRDVSIVKLAYKNTDPELAWKVPEVLVAHYITQRQERQTLETRSTIAFLRQQITAISNQLGDAEKELKVYRERNEVIAPQTEASNQMGRLVSMQTQRGLLDNERAALAALLADVDAKAVGHKPGDPSAYRRLLAFPSLLQSQAATGLLQSLSAAEDQRNALLTRRTPLDSDVQALDGRIDELERELRSTAATYLEGITHQVRSLDRGLEDFRRQLKSIPEKELQYARLEREPKVLEGVYTMLQTRLKEAEVAVAAKNPSVRVVDSAIPPTKPVWPRPMMNLMGGLAGGLLFGLAVAFAREYLDRAVRTRSDIRELTGLPVIGLIPRIHAHGGPVALIAERSPRRASTPAAPPPQLPPQPQEPSRHAYTFLQSDELGAPEEAPATPAPPPPRPIVDRVALTIPTLAGIIAEAYGVLQTNIAFSRGEVPVKTLVFTSPLSGDGKTTTVVNLAISLAQRGLRTLLIDADLRRGVVHSVFKVAREPGLSEVLRGLTRFDLARRGVLIGERGTLDFLTTGRLHPGEYGMVASDAMRDLLAQVREDYDVVIVDTPPVNIITDAALLGASADGVVLVARSGVTEAAALSYAVDQLRHVRAPMLGVVLNDIDMQRDAGYDSAYKYFQGYEYSTSDR